MCYVGARRGKLVPHLLLFHFLSNLGGWCTNLCINLQRRYACEQVKNCYGTRSRTRVRPEKTRTVPLSAIQKCSQRKPLGTPGLPGGAFTEPRTQQDSAPSLFPNNRKHNPDRNKKPNPCSTQKNTYGATFCHPKVLSAGAN